MRTSCSESEIKHVSLAPKLTCCRHVIKTLVHAFSCAYIELWMHLRSLESTPNLRSPNFLRASITRYMHAKREPILNMCCLISNSNWTEWSTIRNSNWTEWSTIQGVIARVISKTDEREARGQFEITSTITPFIKSILKSLVILAM